MEINIIISNRYYWTIRTL